MDDTKIKELVISGFKKINNNNNDQKISAISLIISLYLVVQININQNNNIKYIASMKHAAIAAQIAQNHNKSVTSNKLLNLDM